ncbi:hypothetical protein M426DRAFT_28192 [Hypoxylon sp. CI-4A]|nr:hypothetical protein M426DRAFT_28192 [Hypoxylon sp. CI-4A]
MASHLGIANYESSDEDIPNESSKKKNEKTVKKELAKDSPKQDNAERKFICPHCDHHSKTFANLKDHVKYIHIGTKCMWPDCKHLASDEKALRLHLNKNHPAPAKDDATSKYACPWPECNHEFTSSGGARRHVYFHTYDKKKAQSTNV